MTDRTRKEANRRDGYNPAIRFQGNDAWGNGTKKTGWKEKTENGSKRAYLTQRDWRGDDA
jgi:hypothetical protein